MAKQKVNFESDTREAVRDSGMTYEAISRGADVGLSWFQKFMVNQSGDYGVRMIQKVWDFLAVQKPARKRAA